MNNYLLLIGGLATLVVAGELLVKGAVAIALRLKISTLVVGMTVVSMGTSAPELIVSIQAALNGHPDIAIGNVVGSNIANIALILGITALIFPVAVNRSSVRIDWPMMMIASLLFTVFAWNGILEMWEGMVFLVVLISFMIWLVMKSRREEKQKGDNEGVKKYMSVWKSITLIVAGGVGLAFGADWMIGGAVNIATKLGVSERIIAVSMIAFGTSVPELVTSVMASFRRETDITVGNLIGSNIFNLLAILGTTSLFAEIPVAEEVMRSDVFWMLGTSAVILPMMIFRFRIERLAGLVLIAAYAVYMILLF
ncbi:MAG: calcium/sodium antiporter [Flavobacteriales bacterium]|nr:calcium/sodium antiporter [Flavobacteriales bacterium]